MPITHQAASYRIIKGKHYEQWTDFDSLKECQRDDPAYKFIQRTLKDGTVRIFRLTEKE